MQAEPEITPTQAEGDHAPPGPAVRLVDGGLVYTKPGIRSLRARRWRVLALATGAVDVIVVALAVVTATRLTSVEGRATVSLDGSWDSAVLPWLAGLAAVGLYDLRRFENPVEELRRILYGVTLGWAVVIVGSYWSSTAVSRVWALVAWFLVLVGVIAGRRIVRKAVHALRRRGRLRRTALIVGADASGLELAADVARAPWEGLDIIGFVSGPHQRPEKASRFEAIPVVGTAEDLRALAIAMGVSDVLVAPSVAGNGGMSAIVSQLDGVPVELRVAPGLDGFLTTSLSVQPLGARALVAIERVELRPVPRVVKRCLDIALASVGLVLTAPIILGAALAIRVETPGSPFFSQTRVGLRGRRFRMWKLRTMRDGSERHRVDLDEDNEADGVLFKMRRDPRITGVGRVLRRLSIDELPQLVNVLLGNMSLVGPRPPLPTEVDRYDEFLGRRLLVRPGLTGLWQVSGRNELSFEDYVRFDLLYVQNWSIALDLYVLAKTIPAVLTGRGAY